MKVPCQLLCVTYTFILSRLPKLMNNSAIYSRNQRNTILCDRFLNVVVVVLRSILQEKQQDKINGKNHEFGAVGFNN